LRKKSKTVLIVSNGSKLAHIPRRLLQDAGYIVKSSPRNQVARICREQGIDLIVIGPSLPPGDRRRVWLEIRKHCRTPILQLHSGDKAEPLETNTLWHEYYDSTELLIAVENMLHRRKHAGIPVNDCHPRQPVVFDGCSRPPVWKCKKCGRQLK